MPTYTCSETHHFVGGDALLLDTCVLVAKFDPKDQYYVHAEPFLSESQQPLLVPVSVVVEAWGMLVGRRRVGVNRGIELLQWLLQNTTIVPEGADDGRIAQIAAKLGVDYVDASLALLADRISLQCSLGTPIAIATYNTSDFVRCKSAFGLRLMVKDLRSDTSTLY